MFISDNYNFVFFEVPRTGSNSITQALIQLDPCSPTAVKRSETKSLANYHVFDIPDTLDNKQYKVIAAHRNPYERLWSHWKFRNRAGNPQIFKSISWETYVKWVCDPRSVPEIQGAILDVPITEMFDCDRVDFWIQFESLATHWSDLSGFLEVDLPALQHKQKSSDMGSFKHAYNKELAKVVADRFSSDFERFGYSKQSWKPTAASSVNSKHKTNHKPQPKQLKRIAILTQFANSFAAFSLSRVVEDQIVMLLKHGYLPMVLVSESENWSSPGGSYALEGVELVQLPNLTDEFDENDPKITESEISQLSDALVSALADIDVVFTHDLIYMEWLKKPMMAAWRAAEQLPNVNWLHWIHSSANPEILNSGLAKDIHREFLEKGWPRSNPVFFNHALVPRLASSFGYTEEEVKIVPHPIDVCNFLGVSPLVTRIYEELKLYNADFISVSPTRLSPTKQIDWVIKIMARLKANGASVRILVLDFHAIKEENIKYRKELKEIAKNWGLDQEDLTFLSEFDETIKFEAPHSMVRELFSLSNIYIQPSVSESYSLAAQEAAVLGNLLVLNADFPPMKEIYGDHALYFHFSAYIDRDTLGYGQTLSRFQDVEFDISPPNVPPALVEEKDGKWIVKGEVAYADLAAREIRHEVENNLILSQRLLRMRDRNLFSVFTRFVEPLVYADHAK